MAFHAGRGIYLCLLRDGLSQHMSSAVAHTVRDDILPYPSRKLQFPCDIHIPLRGLHNSCTWRKNWRMRNGKIFFFNKLTLFICKTREI